LVVNSVLARVGLFAALAGALALGACGRKGPLEVPPSANAMAAAPAPQDQPSLGEADNRNFEERSTTETPTAGRPAQRSFVLDPLLGDPPRKSPQPPPPPKEKQ
jgi:predicted small lipoprotein YifL